jgi:hypothetical protein
VRGLATERNEVVSDEERIRREIEGKSRDELIDFLAGVDHGRTLERGDVD